MRQPLSDRGRNRTTGDRKGRRRTAEPRVLTTMRLRRSLRKDLEATAARNRRSVADVAQELLEEALQMRRRPGIYFADEATRRDIRGWCSNLRRRGIDATSAQEVGNIQLDDR